MIVYKDTVHMEKEMEIKMSIHDALDTLNPMQREAAVHTEGPLLILAGAGSGKTRVLTHRIAYLMEEKGVNPWNILAITFTNKAASEMRERVNKIAGMGAESVWVSTFHSACVRILRRHIEVLGFGSNFTIYDADDQKTVMKEIFRKFDINTKIYKERGVLAEISHAKDELITPEEMELNAGGDPDARKIAGMYKEYQSILRGNNALDFDDLIVKTVELFQHNPDILDYYQERFKYIMVDEYQDTNTAQFKFVSLLAEKYKNLCVVGDDDQSIYRFRGSKPEIMLGFQKIYPQAKIVNLEVNYRCEPPIVEAAMRLIAHNEERFPKKIRAGKAGKQKVRFQYFEDCYKENAFLAEDIRQTVQNGVPLSEIAVLFRTNMQPRALMEYMVSANLAFQTKDRIPDIYEHWIARDFFTYIRIAQGSDSRADFLSIMNRPKRYIGRDSLPDETVCFDEWMKLYEEQPWIAERIEKLWYDLKHLSRLSPYAAINYIRRGIGYDDYLAEYAEYRNANKEDFYEVADEILASAKGYRTFEEWFAHIEEYRQGLKRLAQEKRRNQNAVTFATLHSAKGLEFTKVYLIDVNEGVMPYKKAVLKQDVEEERRLFYVGMTRAKESLTICSVKKMRGKEVELSRFIKEAGKEP